MNEKFENLGPADDSASDALLARVRATDPAAGFDASALSATLIEDAATSAASAPNPSFLRRQTALVTSKLAKAYQARPRFVLSTSIGAVASVAAFAVLGSAALGGALGTTQNSSFSIRPGLGSDTITNGAAPEFSDSKIAGDSVMAGGVNNLLLPFTSYHYNASPQLSNETGSAHIYQVAALANPKPILQKLADALGVKGELRKGEFSTLTSVADEASKPNPAAGNPSISLNDNHWWFSAWESAQIMQGCVGDAPATDEKSCMFVPEEATAKPSKSDAIAEFISLMKISGFSFSTNEVIFSRDHFSTVVSAEYLIKAGDKPVNTGLFFSISYDSQGKLNGAGGSLATIIDRGSFPTISAKDAVARANDKKWSALVGTALYSDGVARVVKTSPSVGSGSATGSAAGSGAEAGSTGIAVDPMPIETPVESFVDPTPVPTPEEVMPGKVTAVEPQPSPTIQEVTIDKVRFAWMQIFETTGSTWIVPGFELLGVGDTVEGENIFGQVTTIPEGLIEF